MDQPNLHPDSLFLSGDWGTSSLRLRLVEKGTLRVLGATASPEGSAVVHRQWKEAGSDRLAFYHSVLRRHLESIEKAVGRALAHLPLVLSGMASSSVGMKELPYRPLPVPAGAAGLLSEWLPATPAFPHPVLLVSGLRTETDVLRGEETQLAGCLPEEGPLSGLFLFPGTHSKHVTAEGGILTRFATFMTGEFFQLLSGASLLAGSVAPGQRLEEGTNRAAFTCGVQEGHRSPLLQAGFRVRTNDLFGRFSKEENFWYLSGLLIGNELAALPAGNGVPVTLVAGGTLAAAYASACTALDIQFRAVDADAALLRAHALLLQTAAPPS
ncbi:MAG TPA: 2-dehydro-3-deoxygalactonokinase [Chitinophagaceae bacterium]|jgi:2-dehydro-3-deoxygalactonokinase|nr:2-dehydro-3-deoxygalactonokinase [Chitinophagaceae bacterium]